MVDDEDDEYSSCDVVWVRFGVGGCRRLIADIEFAVDVVFRFCRVLMSRRIGVNCLLTSRVVIADIVSFVCAPAITFSCACR